MSSLASDFTYTVTPATEYNPLKVSYTFSSSSSPPLTLSYFNFGGKADTIRLLAFHGKVSFDDHRFERHQFREAKESGLLPFGQMPMLTIQHLTPNTPPTHLPQCNSILRTVARYSDNKELYPIDDLVKCAKIDAILDLDADLFAGIVVRNYKERFGFDFLNSPSSSPFLDSVTQNLKDRVIPQHLSNLEKLVGGNGWLGGDWEEPTVADFNFGVRLEYLNNLQELDSIVDKYPKLKGFVLKFKELESNVEYKSLCG